MYISREITDHTFLIIFFVFCCPLDLCITQTLLADLNARYQSPASLGPLDFFLSLVPLSFFEDVVRETNKYMQGPYNHTHKDIVTEADNTGIIELLAFTGCLFAAHINGGSLKELWNADYGTPVISRTFTMDRFNFLFRTLHLIDNSRYPRNQQEYGFERLQKLRPLIDVLMRTFRACFVPGQWVSLDEAMLPLKVLSAPPAFFMLIVYYISILVCFYCP